MYAPDPTCVITCIIAFTFVLTACEMCISVPNIEIVELLSNSLTSGTDCNSLPFIGTARKRHVKSTSHYNRWNRKVSKWKISFIALNSVFFTRPAGGGREPSWL